MEETIENLIDPAVANMSLTWIPNIGIFVIVMFFVAIVVAICCSKILPLHMKITRIITSFLWSFVFIAFEVFLSSFASSESISGAQALFIAASVSACFAGVSALIVRSRNLFEWEDTTSSLSRGTEDNAKSASAFWKPSVPERINFDIGIKNYDSSKNVIVLPAEAVTRSSISPQPSNPSPKHKDIKYVLYRILVELSGWVLPLLAIGGITVICFLFLEMPSNPVFSNIADIYMTCELSIIASFVVGCWLLFQRRPIGFVIPMVCCLLYGIAEYFVETFKAAAIMPSDVRSLGTGMSVAGGYEYDITSMLLILFSMFCLVVGAIVWLKDPLARILARKNYMNSERIKGRFLLKAAIKRQKEENKYCLVKNIIAVVLSTLLGVQFITSSVSSAVSEDWHEKGIIFDYWQTHASIDNYGIIPSFLAALQLEELEAPQGYSTSEAKQLQAGLAELYDQYVETSPQRQAATEQFEQLKPNVIFVMNESFSNLSYLNNLGVGYEGPQYLNNIDAIAKGQANVSVYGGSTCNSEFEGLTGTSLGYISGGINPYALYDLSALDSLPKQFKALGYETVGIHPELATNWRRDEIYPMLGFDEFIDADYFVDAQRLRTHVRDFETYDMAIDKILSSDEPQFIFNLTMMGHGGYDSGLIPEAYRTYYDFVGQGILDEYASNAVNEYLSSIQVSDYDLQHLIDRLNEIDEPTVVVFYGDHQPGISVWFQEGFADHSTDISFQESMYQTEYFIWANYPVSGSDWDGSGNENIQADIDSTITEQNIDLFSIEVSDESQPLAPNVTEQDEQDNVSVVGLLDDTFTDELSYDDESNMGILTDVDENIMVDGILIDDAEQQEQSSRLPEWPVISIDAASPYAFIGPIDIETKEKLKAMKSPIVADVTEQVVLEEDIWHLDLGDGQVLYAGNMSPANLMGWTKTFIGAPLSEYEKASYMSRWWVQSNNIYGYMDAVGIWHPMSEADAYIGDITYEYGMNIIADASFNGLPLGETLLVDETQIVQQIEPQIIDGEVLSIDENTTNSVADITVMSPKQIRQKQDAVMVNVMKWISYMNFVERLK